MTLTTDRTVEQARTLVAPSLARRAASRLIDSLVGGAVALAAWLPLPLLSPEESTPLGRVVNAGVIVGWVAALLYEPLTLASSGQTLGRRATGTRVVDLATGRPPSRVRIAVRVLALDMPLLLTAGAAWWVLALIVPASRAPLHRAWPDQLAGTVVTCGATPPPA